MKRRLAAILAADVAGYSRLMAADELGTLAQLKRLRTELIEPKIAQFQGRVVGSAGDSLLVEFASALNAVQCAVEVQAGLSDENANLPEDRRMAFRIGVNLGDVIPEDDTIHGDGVNIAARLEKLAEPGSVCIGSNVYDQVKSKLAYAYADLGEQRFHNIAERVRAYQVKPTKSSTDSSLGLSPKEVLRVPARDRDQPSVAVMPFDNLSSAEDDYFVDGVVEEITSALSRIRDFFVIARQSTFTYKGRFVDVREVGAELGVSYVVEGTVRRGQDRLRISVQLIDAESRKQLWSERFEGASSEIFDFQDRIAAQVAGAIHPAVRHAEIALAKRKLPKSLKAYDLVMRAYPKLWGQNASAVGEAVATLQEAVAIDPEYGRAHALLAWCHALNVTYLWSPDPARELEDSLADVNRASGLIEDDPTALTACGAVVSLAGDQEKAAALIQSALILDPNNAWAWTRFGWVAIYSDQAESARVRFERAMELSPLDPFVFNMRIGFAASLALAGRLQEAVVIARDVVTKNPHVTWAYRQLAAWAGMNQDLTTARWAARRLLAAQPDFTISKYIAVPALRNVTRYREAIAEGLRAAGIPEN
jgi:TolB-like protein/class 3 adenylate cyclase